MSELTTISNNYKKEADVLLAQTGLIEDLHVFGEVHFSGAYAGNVMMHGDIDLSVVRSRPYSSQEVLDILKVLYSKGKFRSYFIKGDWDDDRKGAEFPNGHYIGMKQRLNGVKWKVDVWFIGEEEFKQRTDSFLDIGNVSFSEQQRELILELKRYRQNNTVDISGQEIYEAVLQKGIKNIEEFKKIQK